MTSSLTTSPGLLPSSLNTSAVYAPSRYLDSCQYIPHCSIFLAVNLTTVLPICFGNLMVIVAVLRFEHLRTPTNSIILSLAFSDLLVGIVGPFFSLVHYTNLGLNSNKSACLLSLSLMMLSCGLSLGSLVAISIDRFVSVQKPLRHSSIITMRRTSVFLVMLWIYGIAIFSLPIIGWNDWAPHKECGIAIVLTKEFLLIIFCHLLVFLLLTGMLYGRVFYTAWKAQKLISSQRQCLENRSPADQNQAKISHVMAYVLGVFYICWAPFFILSAVRFLIQAPEPTWLRLLYQSMLCVAFSNSFMNPLIYALRKDDFRRAFCKMLGGRFLRKSNSKLWMINIPLQTQDSYTHCGKNTQDSGTEHGFTCVQEELICVQTITASDRSSLKANHNTCNADLFLSDTYRHKISHTNQAFTEV